MSCSEAFYDEDQVTPLYIYTSGVLMRKNCFQITDFDDSKDMKDSEDIENSDIEVMGVLDGTSGTSADVPGVGLKRASVSH